MKKYARLRRGWSVLALVITVTSATLPLGMSLLERSAAGARTAAWAADRLVVRSLAESAAEELRHRFRLGMNRSGDPTFLALREGAPEDRALPGLRPEGVIADLASSGAPGAGVMEITSLEGSATWARLTRVRALSPDPVEREGLLEIGVAVRLAAPHAPRAGRLVLEHSFRVVRTGLPAAFPLPGGVEQLSLCITRPDGPLLQGGRRAILAGSPGVGDDARTLLSFFRDPAPGGLFKTSRSTTRAIDSCLAALQPAAAAGRAHHQARSAAHLLELLRRPGPTHGVFVTTTPELVRLELPAFRGRCMILTPGPVEVGDLRVVDPARDSLTIASRDTILVDGRQVDAALICTGDSGLVFRQQARVRGPVVTPRFPRGEGLTADELKQCRIGGNMRAHHDYMVALSPHPVRISFRWE